MLYLLIGIGVLLLSLAFLLTEQNAKYLLSGYNTMSEQERAAFDLRSYLRLFKRFHVFLGLSMIGFGAILYYWVGENAVGVFLGIYPIAAYLYFVWRSMRFGGQKALYKVAIGILLATLLLVIGLMYMGLKEDQLTASPSGIVIDGIYGETLDWEQIAQLSLVNERPRLNYRSNGFSMGKIKKGYFVSTQGKKLKLILNSDQTPLIKLTLQNGEVLYYSAKSQSNTLLFDQIKQQRSPLTP
jgi:hypothetical protein